MSTYLHVQAFLLVPNERRTVTVRLFELGYSTYLLLSVLQYAHTGCRVRGSGDQPNELGTTFESPSEWWRLAKSGGMMTRQLLYVHVLYSTLLTQDSLHALYSRPPILPFPISD